MNDGQVRFKRKPLIEVPSCPLPITFFLPIHRMLSVHRFSPFPAIGGPELTAAITVIFDKRNIFRLRHGSPTDYKWFNIHGMCPFFVVENERFILGCPQEKCAAWDFGITWHQRSLRDWGSKISGSNRKPWRRIRQCLPCISKCLVMHIFVESRVAHKIEQLFKLCIALECFDDKVTNFTQVRDCLGTGR